MTPRKVVAAVMGGGELKIGPLTLPPVSMRHLLGLSAIENQLVTGKTSGRTIYEMMRALAILSAEPAKVPELVKQALQDPNGFDARVWSLADVIPIPDTVDLAPRLDAHIDAAFATAVAPGADGEGEQERPFVRTSPPADGSAPSPKG